MSTATTATPIVAANTPIPITILTGFLGSGKTTLLLSLLPQLPATYKLCLLKNEFGDVAVDSRLAQQSSVAGVTELLNGCICCNLVGQLSDALLALRDEYKPTRIVIETSGSAFPATLAMEVNRISAAHNNLFPLDGVIQVIDVENWTGYSDTSYTAKLQAKFTDLIVLNKHEFASPARVDEVIDRIRDVSDDTPIVRADQGWVDKDVVFGIDSSLARDYMGGLYEDEHDHEHSREVDVLSLSLPCVRDQVNGCSFVDPVTLESLLTSAPKDEVYRIKGILRFRAPPPQHPDTVASDSTAVACVAAGNRWVLNWAFGRWRFTPLREGSVVTTIDTQCPMSKIADEFPPSSLHVCKETEEALKKRKGSIEVHTTILTVVEEKTPEAGECARLTFVLAKGEGRRWKRRLMAGGVKYDLPALKAVVKVESLV